MAENEITVKVEREIKFFKKIDTLEGGTQVFAFQGAPHLDLGKGKDTHARVAGVPGVLSADLVVNAARRDAPHCSVGSDGARGEAHDLGVPVVSDPDVGVAEAALVQDR